jgi:hypothetical protein
MKNQKGDIMTIFGNGGAWAVAVPAGIYRALNRSIEAALVFA